MSSSGGKVLCMPDPDRIQRSRMTAFRSWVSEQTGAALADDHALFEWSTRDVAGFWRLFVEWTGVRLGGAREPVLEGAEVETATFFPGAKLSYVDHVLRPPADDSADVEVVIGVDETGAREALTRRELRRRVACYARELTSRGVRPGDRVVGIARNVPRTLVLYLATLSLGAVWSSVAPDMGTELLVQRVGQVHPKLVLADLSYPYHGAVRENVRADAISELVPGCTIVSMTEVDGWAPAGESPELTLAELPFNHPLVILFSSGTTGLPKCIMHGAGGTLVEHWKELALHCDLGPGDRLLFHTTAGWMMYNWLVSALVTGASIVLYDGSVSFPHADSLLRCLAEERCTVFGTSAAYLSYCRDAGLEPRSALDLSSLRLMLSTGSVLRDPMFEWAYENVAPVPIHSISGGTDIIGCFVLGSPNLPITCGESPMTSLALDVRAANGGSFVRAPAEGSVVGELVCVQPFPSRPVGFWGDEDGRRFHESYFSQNEGVWTHGDTIELTSRGTARIHGRSDGILNVRGVRIGPGEIYKVLELFPEVKSSVAIEQRAQEEPGGSRLVLLVVLADGGPVPRPLMLRIKKELAARTSPAHVPSVIVAVRDVPRTHNNKVSERAARDAANGELSENATALKNPEVLREIMDHPEIATVRDNAIPLEEKN